MILLLPGPAKAGAPSTARARKNIRGIGERREILLDGPPHCKPLAETSATAGRTPQPDCFLL